MMVEGKAAIVTGSGQGIGLAVAELLAAEGARVVINDINASAADTAAARIRSAGREAVADHEDISTFEGAERLVAHCVEAFGAVDILVNNAGVLRDRMSYNMSEAEWDLVMDVCLKGTFACSRFAAREMRAKGNGGRIINVTSRSGLRGILGQSNYAAAKAGVVGLTRVMCQELSKSGITVNAISPRAETAMTHTIPDSVRAARDAAWAESSINLRGTPEQVAPLVVFLASKHGAGISGQVIGLGGDKLSLWTHPTESAEAYMPGGWSAKQIAELFSTSVGRVQQTVGINS